jgi:hypothetical protein
MINAHLIKTTFRALDHSVDKFILLFDLILKLVILLRYMIPSERIWFGVSHGEN